MKDNTPSDDVKATRKPNARTTALWPCVFGTDFVRDQVDPRVKAEWQASRADKPKFGDLRNTFRREHCRTLNPYGSESCPFRPEDCGIAFLKAVQDSLGARNPHGYFIKVARSSGALRADMAVEDRAHTAKMRTNARERAVGGPDRDGPREGSDRGVAGDRLRDAVEPVEAGSDEGLRRPVSRPQRLGSLLGSLDLGPRQGRDADRGTDQEADGQEEL